MKKRIGSKLYDTEKSELICRMEEGSVYRKRTREREWFLVSGDSIEPLEDAEARAMTGTCEDPEPESKDIMVRVDRKTHAVIAAEAKRQGCSISEMIRKMSENMV